MNARIGRQDITNGAAMREAISPAEREVAAKFYEAAAARAMRGPSAAAAKALNEARANFWRNGGVPPGDIHSFEH